MSRAPTAAAWVRIARDFAQATRGVPFRVALVLSLAAHLALLVFIGRRAPGPQAERIAPSMRVHLVVVEPAAEAPSVAKGPSAPPGF